MGGGKWSSERQHDFLDAKPHLTWFFDKFLPKVGKDKAWAWLDSSDTDVAKSINMYLKKWGSSGQKRLDYMKASPWLKMYFGMAPAARGAWLRGDSEGAKVVLAYFKKYGSEKGMTQHARDYLDVKPDMEYYFSLSKETRDEWLKSGDPRAVKVLGYFKKYGKKHQFERAFSKLIAKYPGLAHGTPEQARRMAFWAEYFKLTPDQRPGYIADHAEQAGVFIYGEFGEQERHDREMEFTRRAVGMGINKRQSAYLYVKPLLDFYRTLPKGEKPLFLRANPELQEYFDKFATKSLTGDKKLDAQVEQYFSLPPDSLARSAYLKKHPAVQEWFDKKNPSARAMHHLLDQYFTLTGDDRASFAEEHPEIQAYFDKRRIEKGLLDDAYHAFDESDPRLRPFFDDAKDLERSAENMRRKLRQSMVNRLSPDTIGDARTRQPYVA
jgi:hypothetical protein